MVMVLHYNKHPLSHEEKPTYCAAPTGMESPPVAPALVDQPCAGNWPCVFRRPETRVHSVTMLTFRPCENLGWKDP